MKRFFKFLGFGLGGIIILIACYALYVQLSGIPTYPTPPVVEMKIDVTDERVANGMRIATMQCVQCHANGEGKLTGRLLTELPGAFGKLYSKNITHDPTKGIGAWTDGELYYFLRTGVRKDGTYAPPYMPKFPRMADEDLKDVIAWLRSDSFGLEASTNEPPDSEPSLLIKVLTHTMIKPIPYQTDIARPDTTDMVKLGEYYANGVASCFTCHSGDLTKINDLDPTKSFQYYGGGSVMTDMEQNEIISANLTPDETGIAHYSEDDFVKAVRWGKKPDGTLVRYPMVPHPSLTEKEVRAIYAFLKTVPKINNKVN